MPATINGFPGATQQPSRYGKRQSSGYYSVRTWRGPKNAVAALVPQIESLGYDYEVIEEEGPFASIVATLPSGEGSITGGAEVVAKRFQLLPITIEKDLLSSNIAAIVAIDDEEKRKIRNAIQNPADGQSPALTSAAAIDVYKLMLAGVTSIKVSSFAMELLSITGNDYEVAASVANCDRVLTSATMIAETGTPPLFFPALNGSPFTDAPSDATLFRSGWYKNYPTIENVAGGKVQISQRYDWGIWPKLITRTP
jgi:hypothetical protein